MIHLTNLKKALSAGLLVFLLLSGAQASEYTPHQSEMIKSTKIKAQECRTELIKVLVQLIADKHLSENDLFDTFYVPVPGSNPQKYHTRYDRFTDKFLLPVLDKYLEMNENYLFVIAVDKNGYVPTHNSKYSKPLTGISDYDAARNRTKRIFNDRTGIKAALNKKEGLLQKYSRDTGEIIYDYSLPVYVLSQHWGALRIGFELP
jgi:methyl-accepting chemotaxis protein